MDISAGMPPDEVGRGGEGITPELARGLFRAGSRVVVLGDAILDVWLSGRCDRLCREAPAPVVDVRQRSYAPGGAANTAVNLAALGARVSMVTAVGDDATGRRLCAELRNRGVGTDHVAVSGGRATVSKRRIVAGDQLLLRFDDGDTGDGDDVEAARLVETLRAALADADALVVCDYANGALGPRVAEALRGLRSELPLLVLDAHDPGRWRALRPDLVTPNAAEAAELLGTDLPDGGDARVEFLDRHRDRLAEATGAAAVAVTLDRDGAVLLTGSQPVHRTWARPAPENYTSGAGDTFVAAATVALAGGLPITTAVELAQAAADIVVHRPGTAVCTAAELEQRFGTYSSAALDHDHLAGVVAEHRAAGRRVVFTNGCFDVLHRGHVAYLNEAKRLGDVLIVAVNADESVRRIKGPDRPVNTVRDRAAVLAALSCVDHVTVFTEDTPVELLRGLRPDIYVKGGDYTPEMLTEAPVVRSYGGQVRVLGYVPDHSTSAVIERIRAGAGTGEPA
ncbi:rfaE bifunctional protein, domain I/rfaE bifunctional protein, domain II [Amycolatopsis arida]|uniref:Bifunctional protein HldE n=1 Tax=Amycolatopsis arida TaxID=587909 RepID=A0A1I5YWQ9_9PSEU|nr:D-glycero-beta-D-manno-heptose 1-phosphate adenylyltransferase [Amycolatopsis arida]TDX89947.1 rfaE bifunctional protein kinase chain/domain/rfaE bifunctional protein nucleotidyltransferase chain/domain [Amycolatopsis arida]SFQ48688.1 rfaE bifunctional protein, domain I/rfaE bifunctional protein, domain II [Amycolatopsis arida]